MVILLCNIVQMVAWLRASKGCQCAESSAVHLPALDPDAYNFPSYLPMSFGPPVSLTLENSVHYTVDSLESDAEYESLYPGKHRGFIHLGPHKRFFGLSMFHQLHCLDSLRKAIRETGHHNVSGGTGEEHGIEHSVHCLNYLRQTILCAADVTLEPEIPVQGTRDVGEGVGVEHVCRDWSRVYEFVERNEAEWLQSENTSYITYAYGYT